MKCFLKFKDHWELLIHAHLELCFFVSRDYHEKLIPSIIWKITKLKYQEIWFLNELSRIQEYKQKGTKSLCMESYKGKALLDPNEFVTFWSLVCHRRQILASLWRFWNSRRLKKSSVISDPKLMIVIFEIHTLSFILLFLFWGFHHNNR